MELDTARSSASSFLIWTEKPKLCWLSGQTLSVAWGCNQIDVIKNLCTSVRQEALPIAGNMVVGNTSRYHSLLLGERNACQSRKLISNIECLKKITWVKDLGSEDSAGYHMKKKESMSTQSIHTQGHTFNSYSVLKWELETPGTSLFLILRPPFLASESLLHLLCMPHNRSPLSQLS